MRVFARSLSVLRADFAHVFCLRTCTICAFIEVFSKFERVSASLGHNIIVCVLLKMTVNLPVRGCIVVFSARAERRHSWKIKRLLLPE